MLMRSVATGPVQTRHRSGGSGKLRRFPPISALFIRMD